MRTTVAEIVLQAIHSINSARPLDRQLSLDPQAPLFGNGSTLDSLGLVALVIDVEDGLRERGIVVDLTSTHAMSRSRSPFRSAESLIDYILSRTDHGD
jgi:acyl carrier protein